MTDLAKRRTAIPVWRNTATEKANMDLLILDHGYNHAEACKKVARQHAALLGCADLSGRTNV